MPRKPKPILQVSASPSHVERCFSAVDWVTRRLRLEFQTGGRLAVKGKGHSAQLYKVGKPLVTKPLQLLFRETGMEGVPPNTSKVREAVFKDWNHFYGQWQTVRRRGLDEVDEAALKGLIARTNVWLDETLATEERSLLQAYLRQRAFRIGAPPKTVELSVPQSTFDALTSNIDGKYRKSYLIGLMRWAAQHEDARAAVMSELGLVGREQ